MKQPVNDIPGWLPVITNFISDNIGWIAFIVFIVVFRDALSDFLKRLTGLHYSNGDSKLGLNAEAPSRNDQIKEQDESQGNEDKPQKVEAYVSKDGKINWFSEVEIALENNDVEKANKIFKEYELNEKDETTLHKEKSVYFFLLFRKGNVGDAISSLEKHYQQASTEDLRFDSLTWLSICLHESKQYQRDIELWSAELPKFKSLNLTIDASCNLAKAYRENGDLDIAKSVILPLLAQIEKGVLKASLYSTLAIIEEDLGNKVLGAYCRDKAVENNPENMDQVFTSAYNASNSGIDDLAISNYVLLTSVSPKNSIAWNNLGVQAKESGCKYKSIEFYGKAIKLNETLAMANQGYELLDAGFVDEAECIARKALEMKDVHRNVYGLMSRIETVKKEESNKWEEIQRKSSVNQAHYRKYTEKYYVGKREEFDGMWYIENQEINISNCSDQIILTWETIGDLSNAKIRFSLRGKVTGATFQGHYKSESIEQSKSTLLLGLGNFETRCLGYVEDGHINVFSTDKGSERTVKLSQNRS